MKEASYYAGFSHRNNQLVIMFVDRHNEIIGAQQTTKENIMKTYFINIENTGLETDEQVEQMAQLMRDAGHDVEATRNIGAIQGYDEIGNAIECPLSEKEFFSLAEQVWRGS